jgi:MoaA/NifB/PqqE/SkfB family radical SAM enzyme
MPFDLYRKIAEEVFPYAGYLTLSCLTEPLMNRDLVDRLELLKTHPVPFVEMITNGTLLTERVSAKLVEVPIHRLGISLDGATAETYEAIRIGASFDKLIANLRHFLEIRRAASSPWPRLRLLYVLSERNLGEFEEFLALARSLEADAVDVRTVNPFAGAQERGTTAETFWEEVQQVQVRLEEWCRATGTENVGYMRDRPGEIVLYDEEGRKRTCRRPWTTASIHFNGDVQICATWERGPVGNLVRQSFAEIWQGEPLARLREEFEREKPGIDCVHCRIKKGARTDDSIDDPGFYQMLAKRLVEA